MRRPKIGKRMMEAFGEAAKELHERAEALAALPDKEDNHKAEKLKLSAIYFEELIAWHMDKSAREKEEKDARGEPGEVVQAK